MEKYLPVALLQSVVVIVKVGHISNRQIWFVSHVQLICIVQEMIIFIVQKEHTILMEIVSHVLREDIVLEITIRRHVPMGNILIVEHNHQVVVILVHQIIIVPVEQRQHVPMGKFLQVDLLQSVVVIVNPVNI